MVKTLQQAADRLSFVVVVLRRCCFLADKLSLTVVRLPVGGHKDQHSHTFLRYVRVVGRNTKLLIRVYRTPPYCAFTMLYYIRIDTTHMI
jgi:hypothetical protein